MYWVLPWECCRHEGGIIRSAIDRWSDCIGQDRDSRHLGTLSTILQHFTHTMKPSDPLLLSNVTLHCGMYPADKVDTLPSLGSPRVTTLLASPVRTLVYCVVKHSRPPDLKSSSNVSLPFALYSYVVKASNLGLDWELFNFSIPSRTSRSLWLGHAHKTTADL